MCTSDLWAFWQWCQQRIQHEAVAIRSCRYGCNIRAEDVEAADEYWEEQGGEGTENTRILAVGPAPVSPVVNGPVQQESDSGPVPEGFVAARSQPDAEVWQRKQPTNGGNNTPVRCRIRCQRLKITCKYPARNKITGKNDP
jgi:hypothetical protein